MNRGQPTSTSFVLNSATECLARHQPVRSFERRACLVAFMTLSAACSPATGSVATPASNLAAGSSSVAAPSAGAPGNTPGLVPSATSTAGTGGGASAPQVGPDQVQSKGAPLPCAVAKVVSARCQTCHGSSPIGGAPMPLVTQSDFTAQIKSLKTVPDQTMQVAKLVKMRANDASRPMPPGALLADDERATLNAWLDQSTPPGAASDLSCVQQQPTQTPQDVAPNPDGTRCYQFHNHGQSMAGDTTPYSVGPGEQYVSFYYTVPWQQPSELVRFRTIYDNRKVLHHWLLYSTVGSPMDGGILPSIGTHLGDAAQLIAGWAVGGSDVSMPPDVGLRMPPPGSSLLLEYHFYNTGTAVEMDRSSVEVCMVPAGSQKHTAGITWLGTENFNGPAGMPPKVPSQFGGTCTPSRKGMNATDPIHIFNFWPHMHTYGRNMRSVINRVDGSKEEVFNKPFDFNYQVTYPESYDLNPGDTITSTCDFLNTSNSNVAFGPSTTQEMCYQFTYSYPAGALENGVPSLVGATNTCW
jgi:hypothetical protein